MHLFSGVGWCACVLHGRVTFEEVTTMKRRGVRACALGVALLSSACIATPDEPTSDAPDESLELDEKTQAFKVLNNGTIG